jgi:dihydroneopterin aldolase
MLMSCVIGIYPSERHRKQPVTIDLCLYLDTRQAAQSANITDTIDYAGALKEVSFILEHCEFLLIETAVEAICRHFILTYQTDHALPNVEAVVAKISKPSALSQGIVPSVQVLRRKADYELTASKVDNCAVYTIHSAADAGLSLLVANSPAQITVSEHIPSAQAVLPIGRWSFGGEPTKSRQPISLKGDSNKPFSTIDHDARGPKLLLIQTQS